MREGWLSSLLLVGAAGLLAVEPLARGVLLAIGERGAGSAQPLTTPSTTVAIVLTITVPLLIGAGASLLGWSTAWWLRSLSPGPARRVVALLIVPLLLPMYLAFAGWGLARGPGTTISRWLSTSPDLSVLLGQVLACLSLVLWAWPISTLLLLGPIRGVPRGEVESLRALGAGWFSSQGVLLTRLVAPVLLSIGLIALLMLGSAVPLHLAQINTLAISLWAELALNPASPRVWMHAWPLLLTATLGAALLTRLLRRAEPASTPAAEPITTTKPAAIPPLLAWLLGVAFPGACFIYAIHSWPAAAMVWRESLSPLAQSLGVGVVVGFALVLLALGAWRCAGAGAGPRRIAALAFGSLSVMAILPGVFTGMLISSTAAARAAEALVPTSTIPVMLGHVSRFGALGIAAGLVLASGEPRVMHDLRQQIAGRSLAAWLRLAVRPALPSLLGVGVAGAALSLHEIEATVQLRSPGTRPIAQVMLDNLHMNSLQELASTGLLVLTGTLILALLAATLLTSNRRG